MAAAIKAQFGNAMELKELARPDASGELKPLPPASPPHPYTHKIKRKRK
jgi:hypothetical protein